MSFQGKGEGSTLLPVLLNLRLCYAHMKVGEVATWEKLNAIECNCTIEATLDNCLARVTNQVRGSASVNRIAFCDRIWGPVDLLLTCASRNTSFYSLHSTFTPFHPHP